MAHPKKIVLSSQNLDTNEENWFNNLEYEKTIGFDLKYVWDTENA